jgi:hypothetical protein
MKASHDKIRKSTTLGKLMAAQGARYRICPLLSNGLINTLPWRQILDKQRIAR